MSDLGMIEAPGPAGPLSGTALGPRDTDAPVVLIVPGSGPTDRDGNSPLGILSRNAFGLSPYDRMLIFSTRYGICFSSSMIQSF